MWEDAQHFLHLHLSLWYKVIKHVVFKGHLFDLFYSLLLLDQFRLKHQFIRVELQGLTHQIESLIPRKERCQENLSVHCGYRNRVVKNDSVEPFLNLLDIFFGDLQKSISKEYVIGIEA